MRREHPIHLMYKFVFVLFVLGGVREAAPGEDKQDVINEAGKQEIPLTLVNKFEGLAQDDSSDMRALFVRYIRVSLLSLFQRNFALYLAV